MTEATVQAKPHKNLKHLGVEEVDRSKVYVDPLKRLNVRHDLPRVSELADNIKAEGQLTPVVLHLLPAEKQNGHLYTLGAGFRRWAAMDLLGMKTALAVIRPGKSPADRVIDNFLENRREEVHPLDAAERVHQLVYGSYPVNEGEEATPMPREEVCTRLMLSASQVKKYLAIMKHVTPAVLDACRSVDDVPQRLLDALAATKAAEGCEPEDEFKLRGNAQMSVFNTWALQRAKLSEAGRKRAERSDKGKKAGEERKGVLAWTKKIDVRGRTAQDYADVLKRRQAEVNKTEGEYLRGALDMTRMLAGEIERIKLITVSDFEALDESRAPKEEEEEAEE